MCSTSHFSADGGILMTQEIVFGFGCDGFVRMFSCKEIWKFNSPTPKGASPRCPCWDQLMLLWVGNPSQLVGFAGVLKGALATRIFPRFPGPQSRTTGPLPRPPSPPRSGLRISCEPGSWPSALHTGVTSGNYLLDPNYVICGNPLSS